LGERADKTGHHSLGSCTARFATQQADNSSASTATVADESNERVVAVLTGSAVCNRRRVDEAAAAVELVVRVGRVEGQSMEPQERR
jgi:hypothetical protein